MLDIKILVFEKILEGVEKCILGRFCFFLKLEVFNNVIFWFYIIGFY